VTPLIATEPSISTLRRVKNTEKTPVRSNNTQIINLKEEIRGLNEWRGNPLS
jgi:hypothetical protein